MKRGSIKFGQKRRNAQNTEMHQKYRNAQTLKIASKRQVAQKQPPGILIGTSWSVFKTINSTSGQCACLKFRQSEFESYIEVYSFYAV